jgi:hypothetical protein
MSALRRNAVRMPLIYALKIATRADCGEVVRDGLHTRGHASTPAVMVANGTLPPNAEGTRRGRHVAHHRGRRWDRRAGERARV